MVTIENRFREYFNRSFYESFQSINNLIINENNNSEDIEMIEFNAKNIKTLTINTNNGHKYFGDILNLHKLIVLKIDISFVLNANDITELTKSCPNLKQLDLSYLLESTICLAAVLIKFQQLKRLTIHLNISQH